METKIDRKQLYDPYRGEFVYDIVPTKTIRRSRAIPAAAGTHTLMATYSLGPGTVGLLTYLSIAQIPGARAACYGLYRVQDGLGTMDAIVLMGGTTLQAGDQGPFVQRGDRKSPIHTCRGTFGVSKSNAATLGTTVVSWEMLVVSGVPGREGTVTHV